MKKACFSEFGRADTAFYKWVLAPDLADKGVISKLSCMLTKILNKNRVKVRNTWGRDLGVSLTKNDWHEVRTSYAFTLEALNIQTFIFQNLVKMVSYSTTVASYL